MWICKQDSGRLGARSRFGYSAVPGCAAARGQGSPRGYRACLSQQGPPLSCTPGSCKTVQIEFLNHEWRPCCDKLHTQQWKADNLLAYDEAWRQDCQESTISAGKYATPGSRAEVWMLRKHLTTLVHLSCCCSSKQQNQFSYSFSPSICLSLLFLPLSVCLSVCLSLFSPSVCLSLSLSRSLCLCFLSSGNFVDDQGSFACFGPGLLLYWVHFRRIKCFHWIYFVYLASTTVRGKTTLQLKSMLWERTYCCPVVPLQQMQWKRTNSGINYWKHCGIQIDSSQVSERLRGIENWLQVIALRSNVRSGSYIGWLLGSINEGTGREIPGTIYTPSPQLYGLFPAFRFNNIFEGVGSGRISGATCNLGKWNNFWEFQHFQWCPRRYAANCKGTSHFIRKSNKLKKTLWIRWFLDVSRQVNTKEINVISTGIWIAQECRFSKKFGLSGTHL